MITFKCKMCGGDLSFEQGASVAECPYCGTNQTLPKLDDDKRANLYDRANHFRRQNEYDKAMAIYEQVLAEDRTDAEAYWSLVLCRYGIEYVEDPATHKRVPTVNRVQYASILADEDYKSALQYADAAQRRVYEAEASAIAEIQRGILDISRKEEPFDVFICYKETDTNGSRTPDSVLANDMYHQLTKEGFKVFFSRITLEDKIGSAYEPYIFAALNSAKVMVVLGTKPEYFNAVWVKNEWSRYLTLIKSGADKTLVPAYRDMDPYDLPEEFAHLQAQDMGKLGFMQDLIWGIKKILHIDEPKPQTVAQPTAATPANNAAPLVKRAFMSLEDGDFAKADDFCEQALNIDPENGRAWLGKLMAQLKVRRESDLKNQAQSFDGNGNYQKALRFGDEKLRAQLKGDIDYINKRNEHDRQQKVYNQALQALQSARTEEQCLEAKQRFQSIHEFEGVSQQLKDCDEKIEAIRDERYRAAETLQLQRKWQDAISAYRSLGNYRDCPGHIEECNEGIRASVYERAEALQQDGKWHDAIDAYRDLGNYRDCPSRIEECEEQIKASDYERAKAYKADSKWQDAITVFRHLGDYRDSRQQAQQCMESQEVERQAKEKHREQQRLEAERVAKKEKARYRRSVFITVTVITLVIAGPLAYFKFIKPNSMYNSALSAMNAGNYDEATAILEELGDYKDAATQAKESQYQKGVTLLASGDYDEATETFKGIKNYNDSATQVMESQYQKAAALNAAGKYDEAYNVYAALIGYKDVDSIIENDDNIAAAAWRAQFSVGNTVEWGRYEQDDNASNGAEAVEWIVLANDGDTATLISKYALDARPYNTARKSVTWETCTLRKWLNGEFLNTAFSMEEQGRLETVTVTADKNPNYSTNPGNDIQDKVFLLSIAEAVRYFGSDDARICMPTKTAVSNGAYTGSSGACWWWLRSPGSGTRGAAYVGNVGSVSSVGANVNDESGVVRPVVVLRLS